MHLGQFCFYSARLLLCPRAAHPQLRVCADMWAPPLSLPTRTRNAGRTHLSVASVDARLRLNGLPAMAEVSREPRSTWRDLVSHYLICCDVFFPSPLAFVSVQRPTSRPDLHRHREKKNRGPPPPPMQRLRLGTTLPLNHVLGASLEVGEAGDGSNRAKDNRLRLNSSPEYKRRRGSALLRGRARNLFKRR
jgi:hypothetical protein